MTELKLVPTGLTRNDEDRLRRRVGNSLSKNTIRAYERGWKYWREFADAKGFTVFPADPRSLAAFFDQSADTLSLNTLRLVKTAIAKMHKMANYADPCADPVVRAILRAIQREAPPARQVKPLTAEVLSAMAGVMTERDEALFRVMRDGLLRRSEAAALRWEHIEHDESGAGTIYIARSKTDIAGEGFYGYLSARTMAALARIPRGRDDGRVFPICADHIARCIRSVAARAGLGAGYSGHSPRVGMAVDLAESGLGLPALMQVGRWKRSSMPARYIEQINAARNGVAQYYAKQERESPNR